MCLCCLSAGIKSIYHHPALFFFLKCFVIFLSHLWEHWWIAKCKLLVKTRLLSRQIWKATTESAVLFLSFFPSLPSPSACVLRPWPWKFLQQLATLSLCFSTSKLGFIRNYFRVRAFVLLVGVFMMQLRCRRKDIRVDQTVLTLGLCSLSCVVSGSFSRPFSSNRHCYFTSLCRVGIQWSMQTRTLGVERWWPATVHCQGSYCIGLRNRGTALALSVTGFTMKLFS